MWWGGFSNRIPILNFTGISLIAMYYFLTEEFIFFTGQCTVKAIFFRKNFFKKVKIKVINLVVLTIFSLLCQYFKNG